MTDKRNSNGNEAGTAKDAAPAARKPRVTKARAAKTTAAAAKPGVTKTRATRGAPRKAAAAKRSTAAPKASRRTAQGATAQLKGEAVKLKEQAAGKARAFATSGKDKATGALDGFSKLIGDAAGQVDDRLGSQYGDYARTAADAVAALASQLRGKDVDDLVNDARDLVRKSPAVAIGAAAALGFIFVRLIKSGGAEAKPARAKRKPAAKAATARTTRSKTN